MNVEFELETDGRWIAEITDMPGVMVYGATQLEALNKVLKLGSKVVADRLLHGENIPDAVIGDESAGKPPDSL